MRKKLQMSELEPNCQTETEINVNEKKDFAEKEKIDVIELTDTILSKDMFESCEDYNDRICSLGKVLIGEIELKEYDAENEFFTLELSVNENIVNWFNQPEEHVLCIDKTKAKELYQAGKHHPLLINIEYIDCGDDRDVVYPSEYFLGELELDEA